VEQRALGRLAEELAGLAAMGGLESAAAMGARIRVEAERHHLPPWTLTNMIAREWDRQGIVRVPIGVGRVGS
jgi:hypothetical protein